MGPLDAIDTRTCRHKSSRSISYIIGDDEDDDGDDDDDEYDIGRLCDCTYRDVSRRRRIVRGGACSLS